MNTTILAHIATSTQPVALATVVGVRGSAPRHLGTMMLFFPDGRSIGSVGGGSVELEASRQAATVLASGSSIGLEVEMLGHEAIASAPICGGTVLLSIEYIGDPERYAAAAAALDRGHAVVLVHDIPAPGHSQAGGLYRGCLDRFGLPLDPRTDATSAQPDPGASAASLAASALSQGFATRDGFGYLGIQPDDRLLIVGGGHVGLSLARIGHELGFAVYVGDERADYAAASRYPAGVRTIQAPWVDIIAGFEYGDATYAVICTPSHQTDLDCVRALLGKGYRYAGFVGSRRKTRMILTQLISEGFDRAEVEALRAPIGIDIGAETPAEIAISIFTEIIAARRSSPALAIMDVDRSKRR